MPSKMDTITNKTNKPGNIKTSCRNAPVLAIFQKLCPWEQWEKTPWHGEKEEKPQGGCLKQECVQGRRYLNRRQPSPIVRKYKWGGGGCWNLASASSHSAWDQQSQNPHQGWLRSQMQGFSGVKAQQHRTTGGWGGEKSRCWGSNMPWTWPMPPLSSPLFRVWSTSFSCCISFFMRDNLWIWGVTKKWFVVVFWF